MLVHTHKHLRQIGAILLCFFVSIPACAAAVGSTATVEKETPALPPLPQAPPKTVPDAIKTLCPAYPGAEVIQVNDSDGYARVMYKTTDAPEKVIEFYKKELTDRAWTVVFERLDRKKGIRLIMKHSSKRQFSYSAQAQSEKLTVFFVGLREPAPAPGN